jgi:pyocin large subunit-like protein
VHTSFRARIPVLGQLSIALLLLYGCMPLLASGPGFRTEHVLQDHFDKYGHEFGGISKQQYLRLAQQLRDARTGRDILESKGPEGMLRFDKKRGYFGSYENDGTIRSFFIPSDGVRYFARQSR